MILGIDTATAQAGVAIGGADGIRTSYHLVNEGRHSESLAPAIEFVLRQAGVQLKDITGVAVDIGPGLFTGLRVGVSTAKAIAFAQNVPTIPVSSLEILGYAARLSPRKVIPVIDALSDEIYFGDGELGSPQQLAARVEQLHEDVLLVGDGARRYAELFAHMKHVEIGGAALQYPSASALVEIAAQRSPGNAEILYLRKPYVHV